MPDQDEPREGTQEMGEWLSCPRDGSRAQEGGGHSSESQLFPRGITWASWLHLKDSNHMDKIMLSGSSYTFTLFMPYQHCCPKQDITPVPKDECVLTPNTSIQSPLHPPSYPYPYSHTLEHTEQGILSDSTSVFLLLHKRHEANSSICLILESSKFSSRQFFKTPKRSGTRDHPSPLIPSAGQVCHGTGLVRCGHYSKLQGTTGLQVFSETV